MAKTRPPVDLADLELELTDLAALHRKLVETRSWLDDQLRWFFAHETEIVAKIRITHEQADADADPKAQRRSLFEELAKLTARFGRRRQALKALDREIRIIRHAYRAVAKAIDQETKRRSQASAD